MSSKKSKTYAASEIEVEAQEFAEKTLDQVQTAVETATETVQDIAQDNVHVLEVVATAYKSGLADFQKKTMEFTQKNMEQAFAFGRNLFSAKEINELVSLQQNFVRDQAEAFKSQAGELNEIAVRLSSETTKPLQESLTKSFQGFGKSFAA